MLHILLLGGGGGTAPNGGGGGIGGFLPLILIMVVFYVFMILPQTRKAKAQKKFREELKKGDKIVNIAGIHGKIIDMDDTSIVIELEEGVKMRIEKSSISMEATKALNGTANKK